MGTVKKQLTATLANGKEYTTTYAGWSNITGDTVRAIQQRSSLRNRQILYEKPPYSMEIVVGVEKLNPLCNKPRIYTKQQIKLNSVVVDFLKQRLHVGEDNNLICSGWCV